MKLRLAGRGEFIIFLFRTEEMWYNVNDRSKTGRNVRRTYNELYG